MNRKILMGILATVCCIITPKVNAQDSLLIRKMYEANGQHFQDPRAPRFLFMDKEGKVASERECRKSQSRDCLRYRPYRPTWYLSHNHRCPMPLSLPYP